MSRPDIADYLGLTIESNLVNTEISGSYAAIEARSWRRIVLRNCSALNILRAALTRASAKPERITTTQIPMADRSRLSGLSGQNGASERPPAAAITRPDGQRRSSCDTAIKTLDLGQGPRVNLGKNKFFGL